MLGTTKHQIKRGWRFCANERIESADAMRGIVAKLLKKRKKKLLIAVDWVDIKGFQTLLASVVLKGAVDADRLGQHHQPRLRRAQEPQRLRGIAAAGAAGHDPAEDQGRDPGRPGLWPHRSGHASASSRALATSSASSRRSPCGCKGFHGKLLDYPVKKGIAKVLKRVSYRSDGAVTQSVVVRWRKDLPKKRDECWFLMTDQPGTAHQLVQALRPADDHRATVPRRQEQTQRLELAGHPGSPGPIAWTGCC